MLRKVVVSRTLSVPMSALCIGGSGSELQSLTSSFKTFFIISHFTFTCYKFKVELCVHIPCTTLGGVPLGACAQLALDAAQFKFESIIYPFPGFEP